MKVFGTRIIPILFFPLLVFNCLGADTTITALLSNRICNWSNWCGVKGDIPSVTTIYCNVRTNAPGGTNAVGDGVASDWQAIQNSINSCPSNQVVWIPAGTYRITNSIKFKSGVVIRGEDPTNTMLAFNLIMVSNNCDYPSEYGELSQFTSGSGTTWTTPNSNNVDSATSTNGSTNVACFTTNGLLVGHFALIDEDNDYSWMGGSIGNNSYLSRLAGSRQVGQLVEILSKNGTNVTFTPPLSIDYTNMPQIVPMGTIYRYCGMENLSVTNVNWRDSTGSSRKFEMIQMVDSWLTNVVMWMGSGKMLYMLLDLRCSFKHLTMAQCYRYHSTSRSYGIVIAGQSTSCLFEDNVFYRMRGAVLGDGCGPYCVYAYNYDAITYNDATGMLGSYYNHAGGSHQMLWEGNVGNEFNADLEHGSAINVTLCRNYLKGWEPNGNNIGTVSSNTYQRCVNICASNYNFNILGNVLGDSNLANYYQSYWTYDCTTNNSTDNNRPCIYRFGFAGTGFGIDNFDTNSITTHIRHGNVSYTNVYQTNWLALTESNIPSSFYLLAKPGWFGTNTWPPIGPDVTATNGNAPNAWKIPAQLRWESLGYNDWLCKFPTITATNLTVPAYVALDSYPLFTKIYWTTNGDAPTTNSTLYTGGFWISNACLLQAVAFTNGWSQSQPSRREFYSAQIPRNLRVSTIRTTHLHSSP